MDLAKQVTTYKRSLLYSSALLIALIVVSILLNRGVIQGVSNNSDISLAVDQPSTAYLLGQTVVFTGTVDFTADESATITAVQLINSTGPQALSIGLPVADTFGVFIPVSGAPGTLTVKVDFSDVSVVGGTLPGGSLPGTLPGSTLPVGGNFKGASGGGTITYTANWTPPVFLTPAPVFTLVPSTDVEFAIPQLTAPTEATGVKLPSSELKFAIPTVGAPNITALPSVTSTFDIPTVSVSTNANTSLPNIPSTDFTNFGFTIPDLTGLGLIATSSVPNFSDTTAGFAIPTVTGATAPGGEPSLPEVEVAFPTTSTASSFRGLATDGTNFWFIEDGTGPSGVDKLIKVDDSGTSGSAPTELQEIIGPSGSLGGVAFLNGHLWVIENLFRCFDLVESSDCRSHRVFKIDPSDPPADASGWAAGGKRKDLFAISSANQLGGVTTEGTGAGGKLWFVEDGGNTLYEVAQSGSELNNFFTDKFVNRGDAIALSGDFIYTVDNAANRVFQWDKTAQFQQQFDIVLESISSAIAGIKGMTFKSISSTDVLFLISSDNKVYKGFFGATVDDNAPKGIAFSGSTSAPGEALWVLLDGTPFDKIVKMDTSGSLITGFGTSGSADTPTSGAEGVTLLSDSLYVVANETGAFGSNTRRLYKLSSANGTQQASFDLGNTASIFDSLGGITNDGTNLIVHTRSNFNDVFVLDPATGNRAGAESGFPCCPSYNGIRGLAFNSNRSRIFGAAGSTSQAVGTYDTSLNFVQEFSLTQTPGPINNIEGMTFDGNLLYLVHIDKSGTPAGKVSKSFLGDTALTVPTGIAHTPSTSVPGEALWILVDGTPKDKLLKVATSSGSLISAFGTSGFVDAPSEDTTGITFLDTGTPSTSFLWIVANETGSFGSREAKLYKLNANTGAVAQTFNLSSTANIFDDVGGITTDGTNLVLYFEDFNDIIVIDPSNGQEVQRTFLCCPNNLFGARGFARHAVRGQYLAAKGATLVTIDSALQNVVGSEQTIQVDGTAMSALSPSGVVGGLVFDQDVFFMAYKQSTTGKVATGKLVASVQTLPKGITFSPDGSTLAGVNIGKALWVLVDASPNDKILKLDPDTSPPSLITSFGTNGAVDAPSGDTEGVAFQGGHLWIVANDTGAFGGQSSKLYKVKATDGSR